MSQITGILMTDDELDRIATIIPGGAADKARKEIASRRAAGEPVHAFQVPSHNMIVVGHLPDETAQD